MQTEVLMPYARVSGQGEFLSFKSQRQLRDIQIPKCLFDLWLPLIGADAVGVYTAYCRLEHNNLVRSKTMKWLASQLRIGIPRLRAINAMLEECGMIELHKPFGQERLEHMTTTIVVKDAPDEVSVDLIRKFRPSKENDRYEPLIGELVGPAYVDELPKKEEPKSRVEAGRCATFNTPDIPPEDEKHYFPKSPNGFLRCDTTLLIPSDTGVIEDIKNVELQQENPNGLSGEVGRNEQKPRVSAVPVCEKPSEKEPRAHNPALVPVTPGALYLFEMLGKELEARGRSPTKKFRSLVSKQDLEDAEQRMGQEALQRAVLGGLRKGILSATSLVAYISKSANNGSPAKSTLPHPLFLKVAEAIRYNPDAQEHIPRVSRLTQTCQERGYTPEEVRKAGRLWWEGWPGNTGTGPTDAAFLQKIEIVRKEKL